MKKWLFTFFLSFLLITGIIGITNADVLENRQELTLEEAVLKAKSISRELVLSELKLQSSEIGLKEARVNFDQLDKQGYSDYNSLVSKKKLIPSAESGLRIAKLGLEFTKQSVAYEVESKYYNLLRAKKNFDIAVDSLERTEKLLQTIEANYNAGMVSSKEVLATKVQLASQKASVTAAENQRNIAEINFNKAIGLSLSTQISLASDFAFQEKIQTNLEKDIVEAMKSRMDVMQAKDQLMLAEIEYNVAKSIYSSNVYAYQRAQLSYEEAKVNYNKVLVDAEEQIRTAYYRMFSAADQYRVLNESIKLAKEALRLSELRYKVGLQTELDVMSDQLALANAESDALNSIYEYNLAKTQYNMAISIGLPKN